MDTAAAATKVHPVSAHAAEVAIFLAFFDACKTGNHDTIKAHFGGPFLEALDKLPPATPDGTTVAHAYFATFAAVAKGHAGKLDRTSARAEPWAGGDPSWQCKRYVVDVPALHGALTFVARFDGEKLGMMVEMLAFKPTAMKMDPDAEVAIFLAFFDACATGNHDTIRAHFTDPFNETLDISPPTASGVSFSENFYAAFAAATKGWSERLDRRSARVEPWAGVDGSKASWQCKRYVVDVPAWTGACGAFTFVGRFDGKKLGQKVEMLTFTATPAALFCQDLGKDFNKNSQPKLIYKPHTRVTIRATLALHQPAADVADAPSTSHYLVITPIPCSMEQDGVPRLALHEASIECPGKVEVPGLEHYVAALVPVANLSKCKIMHTFVRLFTQLIDKEASVPQGWRATPPVHKRGKWEVPPDGSSLQVLLPGTFVKNDQKRFEGLSELMAAQGFAVRAKDEKDWHYARRAQQFLNARVRYSGARDEENHNKPPTHCLSSRVAMCGHYSNCYRELLSFGGVLCRSAVGHHVTARGMTHCVNEVFLDGCGWIPVEPGIDPSVKYDDACAQWGPPTFSGHPSFGVCDDMLITDHRDGSRSDAGHFNDVRILFGHGAFADNNQLIQAQVNHGFLFDNFDANKNGTLEMAEARKMIAAALGIHEDWPGASVALNAAAHALDLNGDGTITKEELTAAIAKNDNGVAHMLVGMKRSVGIGQRLAQVRPVTNGSVLDGVVKGGVGNPIQSFGHASMATHKLAGTEFWEDRQRKMMTKTHVIIHDEVNGATGEKCAVEERISEEEAVAIFDRIEQGCRDAYAAAAAAASGGGESKQANK